MLDNIVGHKSVGSMSQANTLNKSVSGSSLITGSNIGGMTSSANAIDQIKLDRITAMFH